MALRLALLRAVNVGGTGAVKMADLRSVLAEAGFVAVRTLLQTGNVIFHSEGEAAAVLEERLEAVLADRLGLKSDLMVRTGEEWASIVQANPFPGIAIDDPGHLVLTALKSAADPRAVEELQAAIRGPEMVWAAGRQLYVAYPDGIGRSKLTGSLIERWLGTRGTSRNWNTVMKLAAALAADG